MKNNFFEKLTQFFEGDNSLKANNINQLPPPTDTDDSITIDDDSFIDDAVILLGSNANLKTRF